VRSGSRILRAVVAKKPDAVGLFGLRGSKACGAAPSGLQRDLFRDNIVLQLAKVQPN